MNIFDPTLCLVSACACGSGRDIHEVITVDRWRWLDKWGDIVKGIREEVDEIIQDEFPGESPSDLDLCFWAFYADGSELLMHNSFRRQQSGSSNSIGEWW